MKTRTLRGLVAASLFLSAFIVGADDATLIEERIVVTASRMEQPQIDVPASTTVISREDIDISQSPDLLELLRVHAGIDLARTGGAGGQTSLFMRGGNSNHVLVLIDGVRVASAGTGAFAWENLDLGIIERIEIVRGPAATRWGSDAIGGVIQIFTRRADGGYVRAGYGRYEDRSIQAGFGRQQGALPFSLGVSGRRVDGFSAQNERGFAFDPDKDGHENASAVLNGGWYGESGQLDWHLRGNTGSTEFDQGESDFSNYAGRAAWRQPLRPEWEHELSVALARDFMDSETAFGSSQLHTRRLQASWLHHFQPRQGLTWQFGYDGWRESAVAEGEFRESRWNQGLWAGLDGQRGRLDFQASLRIDRDEWFGSHWTGQAALGGSPTDNLRLYASAARAFRAPTFNQLFSPGFGGQFAGNPDLDPESSLSLETGLLWHPTEGHEIGINLWQTRIDELIDFTGVDFQAVNINEARIRGGEARYLYTATHWRAGANGTWQNAEDRATGEPLLRRAKEKASVSIDWLAAPGSWLGMEVVYTGRRPDVGGVELPSHTLLNLRAGWKLGRQFSLGGRLENVTDRDYESLHGFNSPGRAWFVALSWEG